MRRHTGSFSSMRVGTVACVNTRGRRCRLVILPWCIKVSEDGLAVMTLLRSPTHSVAKGVDRTYRRHAKSGANEPERTLLDPLGNEIIRFKIVSVSYTHLTLPTNREV